MPRLGTAYVNIRANLKPLRKGLRLARIAVSKGMAIIGRVMRKVGQIIKRVMMAAVAAVAASVYAFARFEKQMRIATAVSEVTTAQFDTMSKMARSMAKKLNISATELAKGFYFLGSAGLSATEQLQAFTPVAILSKAATIDMAAAAEMVVDTMKGFNISFAETTRVTDIMALSVTSSNMTFFQLGEALSKVAGVARLTNNTLEETVTALAAMADVGIKGARAGTQLKMAMTRLMAPMSASIELMEDYGLKVYDSNGQMRPFIDLLGAVNKKLKGASEQQRNMAYKVIFGRRAIAGQIALLYKGETALKAFSAELEESGGTATRIAKKQLVALAEQFGILRKEITDTAIKFGQRLVPGLTLTIRWLRGLVRQLDEFVTKHGDTISDWSVKAYVALRVYAEKAGGYITKVIDYFKDLWDIVNKEGWLAALTKLGVDIKKAMAMSLEIIKPHAINLGRFIATGFMDAIKTAAAEGIKRPKVTATGIGAGVGLAVGGAPGAAIGGGIGYLSVMHLQSQKKLIESIGMIYKLLQWQQRGGVVQ